MKIKSLVVISILVLAGCNIVSKKEMVVARSYNDQLVEFMNPVTVQYNTIIHLTKKVLANKLNKNIANNAVNNIKKEHERLNILIIQSIDSIKQLNEFDQKIRYKEASLKYLTVCKKSSDNEIKQLLSTIEQEMTEENRLKFGELTLVATVMLLKNEKEIQSVQRKFADKYMFDLDAPPQDWSLIEKQAQEYKKQLDMMNTGKQ